MPVASNRGGARGARGARATSARALEPPWQPAPPERETRGATAAHRARRLRGRTAPCPLSNHPSGATKAERRRRDFRWISGRNLALRQAPFAFHVRRRETRCIQHSSGRAMLAFTDRCKTQRERERGKPECARAAGPGALEAESCRDQYVQAVRASTATPIRQRTRCAARGRKYQVPGRDWARGTGHAGRSAESRGAPPWRPVLCTTQWPRGARGAATMLRALPAAGLERQRQKNKTITTRAKRVPRPCGARGPT